MQNFDFSPNLYYHISNRKEYAMTGVYEARKKSGEVYYRASLTYKNKHISLGSSSDEAVSHAMYNEASDVINNPDNHWIDTEHRTSSYNESMVLPFGKYISLINFRDNNIYIKTPIYMCHKYFLYFLKENEVLQFSTDDLFYYSNHTIMSRGGYYFVNDYGMQTSILSRLGVRNHSVKGKDYIFKNGDIHDYRYENIQVVNRYNGVSQLTKNGRVIYKSRIHINGDYILGEFASETEAAVAYNKAIDMLSGLINVTYTPNYIEGISSVEYASLYHNIILSRNFRKYVKSLMGR